MTAFIKGNKISFMFRNKVRNCFKLIRYPFTLIPITSVLLLYEPSDLKSQHAKKKVFLWVVRVWVSAAAGVALVAAAAGSVQAAGMVWPQARATRVVGARGAQGGLLVPADGRARRQASLPTLLSSPSSKPAFHLTASRKLQRTSVLMYYRFKLNNNKLNPLIIY